jgi:3-phosphoshikimate 1-carboxyvinyltransferase
LDWIASPARRLRGEICVPGDKSISHRAIMLSALAEGTSRITGFLEGEDTRATARIFEQMGVRIEASSSGERVVRGAGLRGLRAPQGVLDCGNSGTAMRLLCGMMAGQAVESTLTGDA